MSDRLRRSSAHLALDSLQQVWTSRPRERHRLSAIGIEVEHPGKMGFLIIGQSQPSPPFYVPVATFPALLRETGLYFIVFLFHPGAYEVSALLTMRECRASIDLLENSF